MYELSLVFHFCCVSQLLDFEARSGEQVPLLLKMKRSQLALSKAVESGDTDLGECVSPAHLTYQADDITLKLSCASSLHSGDIPQERNEPRRFLYDTEEPTGCSQPLQTGTLHHHIDHYAPPPPSLWIDEVVTATSACMSVLSFSFQTSSSSTIDKCSLSFELIDWLMDSFIWSLKQLVWKMFFY